MRFEFYHSGLDEVPKLSVDGTVSHSIHFSHWQGNETPAEVKADTSTEIALKLVGSPNRDILTQGIDLVTNNHFDTDGVLSVWTVLTGARALELAEQLVPAAEAGDFSEFTNEAAVRASIVLQGSDQASPNNKDGSPLAQQLAELCAKAADQNPAVALWGMKAAGSLLGAPNQVVANKAVLGHRQERGHALPIEILQQLVHMQDQRILLRHFDDALQSRIEVRHVMSRKVRAVEPGTSLDDLRTMMECEGCCNMMGRFLILLGTKLRILPSAAFRPR
jgi:hypothetical protein